MSMRKVLLSSGGQQTGGVPRNGRRRLPRSRGTSLNEVPRKLQRAGEGEAKGDTADAKPGAHEALNTTRVAGEGPGGGGGRAYSVSVTNHPDKERGSPHIWFFVAVLKAFEETLAQTAGNGELIPPDLGKAEAMKIFSTTIENTKFPEVSTWVKACRHLPPYTKQPVRSRIIFAVEGVSSYKCEKQQGEGDHHQPFATLEEVTAAPDGYQRRRINIQDLIRHTMQICGADAPPGRAPRGKIARELSKAISSKKGKGRGTN